MRSIFGITTLLLCTSANAAVVTIDFEEFTPDPWVVITDPLLSKGYVLDMVTTIVPDGYLGNPTQQFLGAPTDDLVLTASGGSLFGVESADLMFDGDLSLMSAAWTITGVFAGGGTVQEVVPTLITGEYITVTFGAEWVGLESATFDQSSDFNTGLGFDNIVVSQVPVPAAIWLFGSALAGLGWFRRKTA
jgi:hypothetical protein